MARFKKGKSGNPGGRPKGLSAYVQEKCGADGHQLIDLLLEFALDKEESTKNRMAAVSELLDRGWNKPSQGMFFSDEMRPLVIDLVTSADVSKRRADHE